MITVACLWVRGHVPYGVEYVIKLKSMVGRHMGDVPFEFVCFTDRPQELAGHCRPIVIPVYPNVWAWWNKLQIFNPAHSVSGRVLFLDLDNVVVADLAPIIDYPAEIAFVPPGGNFKPKGFRTVTRINTSVISFSPGPLTRQLFFDFNVAEHAHQGSLGINPYWGDQDYIGDRLVNASRMPAEWFPRYSEFENEPPAEAKIVLVKKPKPHVAAGYDRWLAKVWST